MLDYPAFRIGTGEEPIVLSTMQDAPLLVSGILRHGQEVFGDSRVITIVGPEGESTEATFTEVAQRAERLAKALGRLGVGDSDRVATFLLNNQTHQEAYLAVPSMGAVLHTLNIRLFPEQLVYVINHAEDKVIIVDALLIPLLAPLRDQLTTVKHIVVAGVGDTSGLGEVHSYEELLAAEEPGYTWPTMDERQAAAMCYTSGTTGDPKGVVYSHRSTYLHSFAVTSGSALGVAEQDRVLPIVPMFHANAWGIPYAAFLSGADLVMPQHFVQAAPLAATIAAHRPTTSAGIPTIWSDLLRYARSNPVDLSSLRMITAGGSAVPRQLIEQFRDELGVQLIQGWGMTETSPLCALALPPKGVPEDEEIRWRSKTGRVVAGVEIRVVAEDGSVLPRDGESVGEFQARGPWITGSYYGDPSSERFDDGWLRTGDIGSLDSRGYMQISDRTKDVIKSGGEWISSVELENEVMAHPGVVEAAVIAVPDERWGERPLVAVVAEEGAAPSAEELVHFLAGRVSSWWLPERWTFLGELPKTSVGKFDKKSLRARYADGELPVVEVDTRAGR
jgi:fatty-acyl-CoA synthase